MVGQAGGPRCAGARAQDCGVANLFFDVVMAKAVLRRPLLFNDSLRAGPFFCAVIVKAPPPCFSSALRLISSLA